MPANVYNVTSLKMTGSDTSTVQGNCTGHCYVSNNNKVSHINCTGHCYVSNNNAQVTAIQVLPLTGFARPRLIYNYDCGEQLKADPSACKLRNYDFFLIPYDGVPHKTNAAFWAKAAFLKYELYLAH